MEKDVVGPSVGRGPIRLHNVTVFITMHPLLSRLVTAFMLSFGLRWCIPSTTFSPAVATVLWTAALFALLDMDALQKESKRRERVARHFSRLLCGVFALGGAGIAYSLYAGSASEIYLSTLTVCVWLVAGAGGVATRLTRAAEDSSVTL